MNETRLGALALAMAFAGVGCQVRRQPPAEPASSAAAPAEATGQPSLAAPPDSLIPAGALGASIRRGRAILADTPDSLPGHVGNALRCTNCHLQTGTVAGAAPWIGVYSRFPQYRSRTGRVIVIEDRVNDCLQRSLNGRALDPASREMRDIVSFFAFLSRGVAPPGDVAGQGFFPVPRLEPDTGAGRLVYASACSRCHGADGEGMANTQPNGLAPYYPPVWGPRSYNIGAGMARLWTAASFVRHNMPADAPGTLTDQQAVDVAAYVVSRSRPDFRGKELDWPNGDPPPDVAYPVRSVRQR
ncbi:MAG: c-type cytochrome [Gemmatimonadales bacterium]